MKNNLLKFINKPLIKGVLKSLPFGVGSLAQNVLSETNGVGNIDQEELPAQLFKIVVYGVLIYLILSGNLSFDDAESVKDLISN